MSDGQWLNQSLQNIEMWKTTYYNSPQAILIGDFDECIYDANLSARELLKIGDENIQGQRLTNLTSRLDNTVRAMIRAHRTPVSIDKQTYLIIYLQDTCEQKHSERLLSFFATTLKLLDFTSHLSANLSEIAAKTSQIAVKNMADWCRIDLMHGNELKLEAIAHAEPTFHAQLQEFENTDSLDRDDFFNPSKVIRSGETVFKTSLSKNLAIGQTYSKNLALLQKLKLNSYICVPIKTAQNILGCISLGRSCGKPTFDSIDLIMAQEFASKVGVNVERTQLYHNLEELKKKADAANQAKTNFLANVSHEIRTPLGAILGFSELLTNVNQGSQEYLNYKEKIKNNSKYLLKIIDDILDLSKVEAGKLNIEIASIDLKKFLQNVCATLKDRVQNKPVRVEFVLNEPMPCHIFSDETRLTQILTNIVGNSIKFTNEGYVRLSVRWLNEPQKLLLFEVRDTGIGISEAQISNLFKPFSQADASYTRKYGGTGLGLALSRNLARELGGDLALVQSDVGQGSTFWITIDPGRVDMQQIFTEMDCCETMSTPEVSDEGISLSLNEKRILLVEDSPDIQVLIKRFLESAGAQVTLTSNGEEGVQAAKSNNFDIILMDVQMPIKDGCEATLELRRNGYQGLIIALTAHAIKEEYECCVKAGYDAHLSKPIRRKELIASILKIERNHKLQQLNNGPKFRV